MLNVTSEKSDFLLGYPQVMISYILPRFVKVLTLPVPIPDEEKKLR